jgi:hypothetical protein
VKFLLDHDIPEDLSYLLEQLGHEVALLRDVLPPNALDEAAGSSAIAPGRHDGAHGWKSIALA